MAINFQRVTKCQPKPVNYHRPVGHLAGVGVVVARGTRRTRSLGSSAPQLEPGSGNLVVEEDTAGVAVQSTQSVKQADRTRKRHRD